MKTRLRIEILFSNLLIITFLLAANSNLFAQNQKSSDFIDFKIVVEQTDKGIKLICKKGCAWNELTFSTVSNMPKAIDKYGIAKLNSISQKKDSVLADFLFTLEKTKNGISLVGIEGTAWSNLNFSLHKNRQQSIDQYGMTKHN